MPYGILSKEHFNEIHVSSWPEFKTLLNGTSASLAFFWTTSTDNQFYQIYTEEYGQVHYSFNLPRTGSADQTDFETNWRDLALRKEGSFKTFVSAALSGTINTATSITSPNGSAASLYAYVTPHGTLRVSQEGSSIFIDSFDSALLDSNRWVSSASNGGTINVVSSSVTLEAGTVANRGISLSSVPTFPPNGIGFNILGFVTEQSASATTNSHCFWGFGNSSGSWSTNRPLFDGYGFEKDTSGNFWASVYEFGTRVYSQSLTRPTDGLPHRYAVVFRSDFVYWYQDSLEVPVATYNYPKPNSTILPIRFHVINSSSAPAVAAESKNYALSVADSSRNNLSISDGTYPWRKSVVDASGSLQTDLNKVIKSSGGTLPLSGVLIGGSDGSLFRNMLTDNTGRLITAGMTASGVPTPLNNITIIGGNYGGDGTIRAWAMDVFGRGLLHAENNIGGTIFENIALSCGGSDNQGLVQSLRTDRSGSLSVSAFTNYRTYSASTSGSIATGTAVGTTTSIFTLFKTSTSSSLIEIRKIQVSWGGGSAGSFSIRGSFITAEGSGGRVAVIARHDRNDGASQATARYGTGAPARVAGEFFSFAAGGTGTGSSALYAADFGGKPLQLRAGVSEGIELRTVVDTTITTAARVAVYVTWTEII